MDKNIRILIVLGILIPIAVYFYDIYLAGIVAVIIVALLMIVMIMKDTTGIPEIVTKLNDDARGIILTNTGNAMAEKIHVRLLPGTKEFEIASLDVDSSYEYFLDTPVQEIKINITYSNENGRLFSSSKKLSIFEEEPDLLKPLIPMFGWKK
ncbi:MAG: hypothetical protein LUQ36_04275 [Methanoregula sp.]|jgi:hypothetical protein|nr:hypothetical protein [Methanoregula sp.]